MSSTFTQNKFLDKPVPGTETGTWGSLINNNTFNIIDNAFGGIVNISLVASDYYMSATDSQNLIINVTGTITTNLNIFLPLNNSASAAVAGSWIVTNNTLGAGSVTVLTVASGSTGVVCPQSAASIIYSDGTNVNFADNRNITGATGGGSNQVFYLNDQTITVSYTIPTSKNAMTAGPITIAGGATVTINPPTVWTIV
jgi:hypothetical protein